MSNQMEEMTTEVLSQPDLAGSPASSSVISNIKLQSFDQPTDENTEERLSKIDELKYFLCTATNDWELAQVVRTFPLPSGESISCVFWNELFHITGTDIVRCLLYRFHLFGRPVTNLKKFEEGIFSDLRNLKPGMDASLEEPKSEFLEMLYKNNCIRTQKKQKVFYWFSVPHDRLFLDALERDLKKEKMGLEPTSISIAEPATSLTLDSSQDLFEQVRKSMSLSAVAVAQAMDENLLELQRISSATTTITDPNNSSNSNIPLTTAAAAEDNDSQISASPVQWFTSAASAKSKAPTTTHRASRSLSSISSILAPPAAAAAAAEFLKLPTSNSSTKLSSVVSNVSNADEQQQQAMPFEQHKLFGAFSLFEGSPTYKQRQRRRTFSYFPFLAEGAPHAGGNGPVDPQQLFHLLQNQHLSQQQTRQNHESNSVVHGCAPSTDDKSYTCPLPQCARAFKRLEHLKRHFRTHTLERPYSCDMCGKQFSRTDNLAQHKKTHNRKYSFTAATAAKATSSAPQTKTRAEKRASSPPTIADASLSTMTSATSIAAHGLSPCPNGGSKNIMPNTSIQDFNYMISMTPEVNQQQQQQQQQQQYYSFTTMSAEASMVCYNSSNSSNSPDFQYAFDNDVFSNYSSPFLPFNSTVTSSPATVPTTLPDVAYYDQNLPSGLQPHSSSFQSKELSSADVGKPLPLILCGYDYCNTAILNMQ